MSFEKNIYSKKLDYIILRRSWKCEQCIRCHSREKFPFAILKALGSNPGKDEIVFLFLNFPNFIYRINHVTEIRLSVVGRQVL